MSTWQGESGPSLPVIGFASWLRIILRGAAIITILLCGVIALLLVRFPEWLIHKDRRPWTGRLVQMVCRSCIGILGLEWRRIGKPATGAGAAVSNHVSWLDIFTLNAAMPVFFVSKAEVRSWPGINILTAVTKTHFVKRDAKLAKQQAVEFAERTRSGHKLLFFPEGTSTDGIRVLPFKPTLFHAFLDPDLPQGLTVQPVTVAYEAPEGRDVRFYGWWADMPLGPSLLSVLAQKPQGRVTVILHDPVPVAGHDRKTLCAACEQTIREGLVTVLGADRA